MARGVLGTEAYAAAEKQGILLRPESQEVQRLALGILPLPKTADEHPPRTAGPSHWSRLTATEQEVAILAAAGWTNAGIALRRGISSRTVDAQIAAVLHKLTITSRKDVIAFVPNHQIDRVRDEAAKRPRPSRER
ncbi:helix-turn-helix transcriptional regulator [Nocardia sp. NPDC004568]|uniref:helix-turn-helix domain-containing protein n=1 Tax=Nocardia sp. NPDC004568 TaxID=3154551 RepID=UPI0033B95335